MQTGYEIDKLTKQTTMATGMKAALIRSPYLGCRQDKMDVERLNKFNMT